MFDNCTLAVPAFFEFVTAVYFDGVGYVDKVAVHEQFADAQTPACKEYVAASDGYLFTLQNGASTCVSSANVKFLAGMRPRDVGGSADSEQKDERLRDEVSEELGQIALAMSERTAAKVLEDQGEWKGFAPTPQASEGPCPDAGRGKGPRAGRKAAKGPSRYPAAGLAPKVDYPPEER